MVVGASYTTKMVNERQEMMVQVLCGLCCAAYDTKLLGKGERRGFIFVVKLGAELSMFWWISTGCLCGAS